MFSKLLFLFGAATTYASHSGDVDTRYFVGRLGDTEFAMAVNKCNPLSFSGMGYQMGVCKSENELVYTVYGDSSCTKPLSEPRVIDKSLTKPGKGSHFDFNCNRKAKNSYAKIEYNLGSCDSIRSFIVYAALDTCVIQDDLYMVNSNDLSDLKSISVGCRPTEAQLRYFSSPQPTSGNNDNNVCGLQNLDRFESITPKCSLVSPVRGTNVYARLLECNRHDEPRKPIGTNFDETTTTTLSPTEEPTQSPIFATTSDNDDDIVFGIPIGENCDDYQDYHSLLGTFDITVGTIWSSRSQVFSVFKSALIDILSAIDHNLYSEDNVKLFIPQFNAEIIEKRFGKNEINLLFSIKLIDTNDVDGSIISVLFQFLIERAAILALEFSANCKEEALKFNLDGFDYVIVNDASLSIVDNYGNVVFSESLGNNYYNV